MVFVFEHFIVSNNFAPTLIFGFTPLNLIQHFAVCCLYGTLLVGGKVIAELCAGVLFLVTLACVFPRIFCLRLFLR